MNTALLSPQIVADLIEEFNNYFVNSTFAVPEMSTNTLAGYIDSTLLNPEAEEEEIEKLCNDAREYNFRGVCVSSSYVSRCFNTLQGTDVKVCAVVGFPLGSAATDVKIYEAEYVLDKGAAEIDAVMNTGMLKNKKYNEVYEEISRLVKTAHNKNALCKIIIETCLLSDEEKITSTIICREAGADFVKTSTGFNIGGAVTRDVALLKFISGDKTQVKASGKIKTAYDALNMIAYGASRIGTSAGVNIVNAFKMKTQDKL